MAFDPEKIDLPKGWIKCSLKDIGEIYSGGTPSTTELSFWGGEIAWVTPADLSGYKEMYISKGKKSITKYGLQNSSAKVVPIGSVLFSSRAPIGYVVIASKELSTNQGFKNIVPYGGISSQYLYYYLSCIKHIAIKQASGTTFKEISSTKFSELPFLLCPTNEQVNIVSKIEDLLYDLETGKAHLKKALLQVKVNRLSILKHAYEGKLTNKKINDGSLPSEWKLVKVSEISSVVRGGSPRPAGDPKYYDGNIPFLKVADITKDNKVYVDSYSYTIKKAGLKKTRKISPNTLLLSNSGATLGVPKITKMTATINDGIAAFLELDSRSLLYLYYFWLSKTSELRSINKGAAQPNLNTTLIKEYLVPYPSFKEQSKIVTEIEKRFAICDELEANLIIQINQSESLRLSILQTAFEGKLVEQNSIDESVELLLEKIDREREFFIDTEKRRRKESPKILKFNAMSRKPETIIDLLQKSNTPIAAQALWKASEHADDIDAFYAQLKKHFDKGEIKEIRKGKDSYLAANSAT